MRDFQDDVHGVLVATDVAARGIHVDDVDVVVHYDPPEEHKSYLHRSGRTARAGNEGIVVTFVLWDQELDVEKLRGWGAAVILSAGPGGEPVAETSGSRVLLCGTPSDIVAMRKENPDMARAWRVALRRALSGPMAHGYRILGAARSGWYVLESGTA